MTRTVEYVVPKVLVRENGKIMLKISMILSTISAIFIINVIPELMPLWMALVDGVQP